MMTRLEKSGLYLCIYACAVLYGGREISDVKAAFVVTILFSGWICFIFAEVI